VRVRGKGEIDVRNDVARRRKMETKGDDTRREVVDELEQESMRTAMRLTHRRKF